jgi:hypothetical protein
MIKIEIIYIFCLFFIISCSSTDEKKCSKLRLGEFYYKGKDPLTGNIIKRNDSVQIVTDEQTGEKIKEKIVWMDPCTYLLYPYPDSKADLLNSDLFPIKIEVLDVTKKYYTVHITSGHNKTDYNDTAWIVR